MTETTRIRQSAVVAYRLDADHPKVMMITSRSRQRWVLPKGHICEGQRARTAAANEAFEEAGVRGRLARRKIGTYLYKKPDEAEDRRYKVKVFPMEVDRVADDWPEMRERERKWMNFPAAVNAVNEPELKVLLRDFGEMLSAVHAGKI